MGWRSWRRLRPAAAVGHRLGLEGSEAGPSQGRVVWHCREALNRFVDPGTRRRGHRDILGGTRLEYSKIWAIGLNWWIHACHSHVFERVGGLLLLERFRVQFFPLRTPLAHPWGGRCILQRP